MKIKLNMRYLSMSLYAAGALALGGIVILIVANIGRLCAVAGVAVEVFKPMLLAFVIAYILNPIVNFVEFTMLKGWHEKAETAPEKRRIHSFSLWVTIVFVILLFFWFFWLVVPQLVSGITGIADGLNDLPAFFNEVKSRINLSFGTGSAIAGILERLLGELQKITQNAWEIFKPHWLPFFARLSGEVAGAFEAVFNVILASVIAVNFLAAKDMLLKQSCKLMYCFIPRESCGRIITALGKTNNIFRRYIAGLTLDSLIVGALCFLGSLLMGIKYPLLIGVIFAVTNFIPFIGPIIGTLPVLLIILADEPGRLIWFLLFIIIVQQLDGNFILPLIHGGTMGVPPVWVLVSITVGGGFFGFIGMVLAVPVFAVLYMFFKEIAESRLERNGLPVSTALYSGEMIYDYREQEGMDSYRAKRRIPFFKRLFRFFKVLFKGKNSL